MKTALNFLIVLALSSSFSFGQKKKKVSKNYEMIGDSEDWKENDAITIKIKREGKEKELESPKKFKGFEILKNRYGITNIIPDPFV
mgnify:CR=1 FL=1